MSTKKRGNAFTITTALLLSLTLIGAMPFYTGGWVGALETGEGVDVISEDVNLEEAETDLENEDEALTEDDEKKLESKKTKKSKKSKQETSADDEETEEDPDGTSSDTINEEMDDEVYVVVNSDGTEPVTDPDDGEFEEDMDTVSALAAVSEEEPDASAETLDEEKQKENDKKKNKKDKKDKKDSDDEDGPVDDQIIDGFPSTYQPLLEELKAAHPNWTFEPVHTGISWKTALDAEDDGGTSLISPEAPSAQKNGNKTYDGHLKRASRGTVAYYLDPRNFLNEDEVFQFLNQAYDEDSQNVDTVASIIGGSFMDGSSPDGGYDNYQACIDDAGEQAGVNANVLAAMIIQEQGWEGSSLVSGNKDGHEGYYNFFNVGAWTTDGMSASERGLWYAAGEGSGETSYGRPWDSPYEAILGGAAFYYENYICNGQNTCYTKKFNVGNGADAVGEHQYMTNVDAANGEGKLIRKAYENNPDVAATFQIPVFDEMPLETCQLPQ